MVRDTAFFEGRQHRRAATLKVGLFCLALPAVMPG